MLIILQRSATTVRCGLVMFHSPCGAFCFVFVWIVSGNKSQLQRWQDDARTVHRHKEFPFTANYIRALFLVYYTPKNPICQILFCFWHNNMRFLFLLSFGSSWQIFLFKKIFPLSAFIYSGRSNFRNISCHVLPYIYGGAWLTAFK